MAFSLRWFFVLGVTLSPGLPFAACQNPLSADSPAPISSLRLLSRSAGYIFDGTVLSVERVAEADTGNLGAVRITFRVEQAIRGVRNGQVLTIREWAGLWNSGERYRTGERLLLFLYSPSNLGLTSTVAGPLGRFPVDPGGNALLDEARLAALSVDQSRPFRNPSVATPRAGPTKRSQINTRTLAVAIQQMDRE